jgi:hypothetical protein
MARAMFQPRPVDRTLEKLRAECDRLRQKRIFATGRHVYYKDFVKQIQERLPIGTRPTRSTMRAAMRGHGECFKALPLQVQQAYNEASVDWMKQANRDLEVDIADLEEKIELRAWRFESEHCGLDRTNNLSQHRLSDDDLAALLDVVFRHQSGQFLKVRMADRLTSPVAPSLDVKTFFIKHETPKPVAIKVQAWQKRLCYYRHEVAFTAFGLSLECGEEWFVFAVGVQNPLEAWFFKATFRPMPLPSLRDQADRPWFPNRFMLLQHPPMLHDDLPFRVDDAVIVVPSVLFQPDGTLCSNAAPLPLSIWEEEWPTLPTAPRRDAPEGGGRRAMKDAPAWALEWMKRQRVDHSRSETRTPPLALEGGDEIEEDELLHLAWEDLDLLHLHAAIPRSVGNEFFVRVRVKDGEHGGYSIGAEASKGFPRQWCKRYSFSDSRSWAVPKFSDAHAQMFATEWCRRHQHYFDIWSTHWDMDYVYTPVEIDSYRGSDVWSAFVMALPPLSQNALRAADIDVERPIFFLKKQTTTTAPSATTIHSSAATTTTTWCPLMVPTMVPTMVPANLVVFKTWCPLFFLYKTSIKQVKK